MNQRFSFKRLLPLIVIMLTACGYFTPVKAQEIIEYDYVCTRYEDESENDRGSYSKIRIRFENEKVFVGHMSQSTNDWLKSKDETDYNWLKFNFDCIEDNYVWFVHFSEDMSNDLGWNDYMAISEDRETVMHVTAWSDEKKKKNNVRNYAEIYTRSKTKSSKKPSWMK